MSSSAPVTETVSGAKSPSGRRPGRRRWVLAGAVVVLVTAGTVVGLTRPYASTARPPASGVTDNGYPTSLATVTHRSLSSTTPVNATLGYAGDYTVVGQAQGTVTWLPAVGHVVRQGQVLYRVDGNPVVLLYGRTPAYRTLSEGTTGADVAELNADLAALGYATSAELDPSSDVFDSATALALEKLQAALGVTQTGTLALDQAVFLPTAARVTTVSATLGASTAPGQTVLEATSTTRQVTIDLDAAQQSEVKAGDRVTITLPDNSTTPGVISSVGTVASSSSGSSGSSGSSSNSSSSGSNGSSSSGSGSTPTVTVEVTLTDPAATGRMDQAPVEVSITTATVTDALVVPVDALLALSGGGYAVEVADPGGARHLVDVTPGIFDDAYGLVQVSGSGLAAGQRVVVPAA
jgi:HlyD family secretion protein/putative peptidoglycan binding protein